MARRAMPLCLYSRTVKTLRTCHRDFKTSTAHTSTRSYKSKFGVVVTEFSSSNEVKPVVAILGWNSSRDKHIAKYSAIFEDKGFDTVCITAHPFNTFFRTGSKVKQISEYLLDILNGMGCSQRPVFLYAFSNGGCAMYFHMMEALTTKGHIHHNAMPVVGTIFDSCPINPNMDSVKIVQESVTDAIHMPLVRPLVWYGLGITVPLLVKFNTTIKRFMEDLTNSSLTCPELILYSKADKLAPYKDIETYIKAIENRGVDVTARCWEESSHVNHYREHTEEYLGLLNLFIDKCLNLYKQQKK